MTRHDISRSAFSRRGFLGLAGGATALTTLAACSSGGSGSGNASGSLKYWDMPWGAAAYNTAAQKLTESYTPVGGNLPASYQVIQWSNFTQTFSSAIASKTGPAVSSGGGFQAFQYADQGAIAYADDLIESFKKDGTYDDYLPGVVDAMKTKNGFAAVPSQLDMRVWWYRKSIFDENGLSLPTTWDEYLAVGKTLAAKGIFTYGIGAGANNNIGAHSMITMMINNGGGLYDTAGELDIMNDRNVEAMDFVKELANEGIIDPAAVTYSTDNLNTQWKSGKIAMGINNPGLNDDLGDTESDILVAEPMTGPHGDHGTLQFLNNIMMYTNTPSQESSEAFLSWYIQNMKTLWQQKVMPALPVLQSIVDLPEFQSNAQKSKILKDWQPIAKTYAAQGSIVDSKLAAIDGGQALAEFTQTMLAGKTESKTALAKLETDIKAL